MGQTDCDEFSGIVLFGSRFLGDFLVIVVRKVVF